jgi:hypothetical protein
MLFLCELNRYSFHYRATFAFSFYAVRTAIGAPCDASTPYGERYGFTLFRWNDAMGLGPLFTPAMLITHDGGSKTPRTHCKKSPAAY